VIDIIEKDCKTETIIVRLWKPTSNWKKTEKDEIVAETVRADDIL